MKNREVDAALVELNYALYELDHLQEEGIETDHIVQQVPQLQHSENTMHLVMCYKHAVKHVNCDLLNFCNAVM